MLIYATFDETVIGGRTPLLARRRDMRRFGAIPLLVCPSRYVTLVWEGGNQDVGGSNAAVGKYVTEKGVTLLWVTKKG